MSRKSLGVSATITVLGTLLVAIVAYADVARGTHPTATASTPPIASPSPQATPPPPSPAPTPPRFGEGVIPVDADLIDPATGWILLTNCAQPAIESCQYVVTATNDAGQTWSRPVQVGPSFERGDGSAPRSVRMLNPLDGFVWGFSGAYATHDGAKTWAKVALPGYAVYDIAHSGDAAWAVTSPCAKGTFCSLEVRSSHDAGRTWSGPHALPRGFSPNNQIAFESGVILSGVPFGDLHLTTDGGLTWRTIKTPCKGNVFRGFIATSDGNELWELCTGYPSANGDTAEKVLYVSEDGGNTWSQKATSQSGGPLPASGILVWLVSNRPRVAFFSGTQTSLVTRDGGATWKAIPADIVFALIRFSGPDYGYGLDIFRNLWTTSDGGDHWTQLAPLAPSAGAT